MSRRRFDHFYIELCCALDRRVPRYSLWLELHERGLDPEQLSRTALLTFFDGHLDAFVACQGKAFEARSRRGLRNCLASYDPRVATPCEIMERLAISTPPS